MTVNASILENPFRPGAGHKPPHLAGRHVETDYFRTLLKQKTVLKNMLLTGLRGVGKTVLMESFKPLAISEKWLWVGSGLDDSAGVDEATLVVRLLTDLSVVASAIEIPRKNIGFKEETRWGEEAYLTYEKLMEIYASKAGLTLDRLKGTLETVWELIKGKGINGVVFAYDEAQIFSDFPSEKQYPLSLLLNLFQQIQRQNIPFMLLLVGLPPLYSKLVEAKTFSERMFTVVNLGHLTPDEARDAIVKPIQEKKSRLDFSEQSINLIIKESGCYPYFIQFICHETFDLFIQKFNDGQEPRIPIDEITRKLDKDFFAARWQKITDRQRDLLFIISDLKNCDAEFTTQEIVDESKKSNKAFSNSRVNQMLLKLTEAGLIYKHRYGKYSFAVPLLGRFIKRQKLEFMKQREKEATGENFTR